MGLPKGSYDHDQKDLIAAVGYSPETYNREISPRARELAKQLNEKAGACVSLAIETMLTSDFIEEPALDDRDRIVIGESAAGDIVEIISSGRAAVPVPENRQSLLGFNHACSPDQRLFEALHVPEGEWNDLLKEVGDFMDAVPLDRQSKLIERLEQFFTSSKLSSLQKAVLISGHMNGVIQRMITQLLFAAAVERMKQEATKQADSSAGGIGEELVGGKQFGKW